MLRIAGRIGADRSPMPIAKPTAENLPCGCMSGMRSHHQGTIRFPESPLPRHHKEPRQAQGACGAGECGDLQEEAFAVAPSVAVLKKLRNTEHGWIKGAK